MLAVAEHTMPKVVAYTVLELVLTAYTTGLVPVPCFSTRVEETSPLPRTTTKKPRFVTVA